MIAVRRRKRAPAILRNNGRVRRLEHAREFAADTAAFIDGSKAFLFDRSIYAHEDVKSALIEDQHEKCAFCEAKPLPVSDGDIEHFRPKAAVRQAPTEALERPAYYWLAYEWTNLLFSCERCNRRHKANLFPLVDPSSRAKSPADDIAREQPQFIDPATEDPSAHITFREHVPVAVSGSVRGNATIESLGLRREALNRDREDHRAYMQAVYLAASLPGVRPALRTKMAALLRRMTTPEAKYSLMSRIALEEWEAAAARQKIPAKPKR